MTDPRIVVENRIADEAPGQDAPESALPRRRGKRGLVIALVSALLVAGPAISYVRALTYPGSATWQMRSVEWVRDHGGEGLVNRIENWRYARHAPASSNVPSEPLPVVVSAPPGRATLQASPANLPTLSRAAALPGEGSWVAHRETKTGRTVLWTTFIRPDSQHAGVIAGVALIRQDATEAQLIAGTRQPHGGGSPEGSQVPAARRAALVAVFNSGFKFKNTPGGFYTDGRIQRPLAAGIASVVIDRNGRVDVRTWGRTARPARDVAAVRQNLHLIVDHGKPVPGLTTNRQGLWGTTRQQLQYTWRSGVGVDARGDLVYVGGRDLTLASLANALVESGVVRGMQLDIHNDMVTFNYFTPAASGGLRPAKLLPAMPRSATRYLQPDQRDFFAVYLR